jgi:hypothetical protein
MKDSKIIEIVRHMCLMFAVKTTKTDLMSCLNCLRLIGYERKIRIFVTMVRNHSLGEL